VRRGLIVPAALGAACLGLATASGAAIELPPGAGGVPDLGAITCKLYSAMYVKGQTGTRQSTLYWTEGLVYARTGRTLEAFLATLPGGTRWTFETLTGHVVDYCRANPTATVASAVEDLWKKLSPSAG
jgi:hypothetical protein